MKQIHIQDGILLFHLNVYPLFYNEETHRDKNEQLPKYFLILNYF